MLKLIRFRRSFIKLRKAENKRIEATVKRMWVESREDIHVLNYFYYKYLTKDYKNFRSKELKSFK